MTPSIDGVCPLLLLQQYWATHMMSNLKVYSHLFIVESPFGSCENFQHVIYIAHVRSCKSDYGSNHFINEEGRIYILNRSQMLLTTLILFFHGSLHLDVRIWPLFDFVTKMLVARITNLYTIIKFTSMLKFCSNTRSIVIRIKKILKRDVMALLEEYL